MYLTLMSSEEYGDGMETIRSRVYLLQDSETGKYAVARYHEDKPFKFIYTDIEDKTDARFLYANQVRCQVTD